MGFMLSIGASKEVYLVPMQNSADDVLRPKFGELIQAYIANDLVDYLPGYSPEEHEVLRLECELPSPLCRIRNAVPSDLPELTSANMEGVRPVALVYVMITNAGPAFGFQSINAGNLLLPKSALVFGDNYFAFNKEVGIMPRGSLDAVYYEGQLLFRSELMVGRFLDMKNLFEPASDHVVEQFFRDDRFEADVAMIITGANSVIRRKIAALVQSKANFTVEAVVEAGQAVGVNVAVTEDQKIVVPTGSRELRELLNLLSDSYVRGTINKDVYYYSNSKRVARKGNKEANRDAEVRSSRRPRMGEATSDQLHRYGKGATNAR